MSNKQDGNSEKRMIEKTLATLSGREKAPYSFFAVLMIVYFATSVALRIVSGASGTIDIADTKIPASAFAGVFSSISNICIILLTLYYGKLGFVTSMIVLLAQFPMIFVGIVVRHNYGNLPGVFVNILTLITILIIYTNNVRIDKYQMRIREQAVTDILTGLPNRFACSELISDLVAHNTKFAVVSIDINDFKRVNDTMGFDAGNQVLIEIASRWKAVADTGISGTLDFVTRLSGDEFALIIRNYKSDEEIENTIRQYESVLGNRLTIDGCDFFITASYGYAQFPSDTKIADALFTYADAAVYEVKRSNSSEHILKYNPDNLKIERIREVESKVRTALDNDTFYFNLQPQFDMSHNLRGFEALARMKDEEGTIISPGEFIPVAEKVGLIDKVDCAVFRKSAAFFGNLIRSSGADIVLSINVSVRHLMKNDFVDEVKTVLTQSGIPAGQLEIEITESIMIDSAEKAFNCITELKDMGVKIAIDDFGTGYSSLSYLNKFPANLLKVDKSFIDKMNTSDSSKQYVAAIISIGHIMGFDVISEGVEEPEQLETLREIGCDFIQGFIWGRPIPPEEAEALVVGSAML